MLSGGVGESPEDVRKNSAFDKFDAVCKLYDLSAEELSAKDDETLVTWLRDQIPESARRLPIDVPMMRLLLKEYVAEN